MAVYITLYYAADSNLYLYVERKPHRLTAATRYRKAQDSLYFREETDMMLGALGWG